MMRRFGAAVVLAMCAVGCNGSSGPGPTRETCSQLGWVCGTDDFGNDCGTCTTGSCAHGTCTTTGGPTTHAIGSGATDLWAAGTAYAIGPFSVPVAGTVTYSVSTTTGDTFDVSIMDSANWGVYSSGGSGAEAYAIHNNTSIASDTAAVPAGSYYLAFRCDNLVERCLVTSYTISATY